MTRSLAALIGSLALAGCTPPGAEPQEPPRQAKDFVFRDVICGNDDMTGVFVNTTRKRQSFEVWAALYKGDRRVDRDVDYVIDLEPGQSETVQFVFGTTGTSCKLESVAFR